MHGASIMFQRHFPKIFALSEFEPYFYVLCRIKNIFRILTVFSEEIISILNYWLKTKFKKCHGTWMSTFSVNPKVLYITLTANYVSNDIINQYYGMIKTFKVLVIVKSNKLAELILLFMIDLSRLISKLSLISRIYL